MKSFQKRLVERQKGSALFIILIAVMLFAALSFTVAQMMRGGNPNVVGEEKAKLYAEEILNYARSLRQAAQNLKISNGCSDTDISVENSAIAGYGHTPAASDDCKLFTDNGGGMVYLKPSDEWLDMRYQPAPVLRGQWFFPGKVCVPGTGTAATGLGCNTDGIDNEAVIAVLPYVREQVCVQLNRALGVTNPGDAPPVENGNAWMASVDKFTGAQSNGERLDQSGQMAGCFEGGAASTPPSKSYHFFQVLIPR